MKSHRKPVLFLRLAAVLAALGLAGCDRAPGDSFSGYVEGDLVFIGPTETGRVSALKVEEGSIVKVGEVVARVEDDLQTADRDTAAAQLKEAEARLANARSPLQRPEEIAVLQAAEQRAAAALDLSRIELERQKTLVPKGASSQANLDSAQHQFDQNQAALDEARKRIAAARIASRTQEIEAAEQAVSAARASLAAAQVRLDRRSLKAPADGMVQTVYYRVGELVPEGRPVVSVLPPDLVKVRFFVPEAALPRVAVGAPVSVTCDGCAPMTAKVFFISTQAEYTPPIIYSREERSKLVYLVEARPENPATARPGQPVNVALGRTP
ncbi:HlyD family efflux transporter periplasmic adaptor subunit [Xanthobacter autotrophicus]|uniref:HlyD family secretion protein n=1 Tax=Xanthobacter TaxID=279 RepID=UPI0024AAC556|nr:HlyD family efflux transporter periplasmic adaptor subunit [Xanthobacter autotrophicus]MDI4665368.1 HlyD family efflux transporter periplasmic adaptor subunit [Xanthobacter autotrophicus]